MVYIKHYVFVTNIDTGKFLYLYVLTGNFVVIREFHVVSKYSVRYKKVDLVSNLFRIKLSLIQENFL